MTTTPAKGKKLTGSAKFAVDMGPLLVFFIAYFMGARLAPMLGNIVGQDWAVAEGKEMFVGIGAFLPAFAIALAYSVWKERRIAPMLLVTGVIVGVLGSLALIFQNKTLFYMKPTISYLLFASVLSGGLLAGRNFLKLVFDGALHMPEAAWRTLTWRFAIAYFVLAVANEIAWRYLTAGCLPDMACEGEKVWVNLKIFGFTGVYFLFILTQAPFIAKNMTPAPETDS